MKFFLLAHLYKGHQLAEDEPVVDHLWVGGERELLHDADEDGRHDQHVGQVHREGGLKEERLEEGGGKGDHHEQDRWQVGRQHLTHDLSTKNNGHPNAFLRNLLISIYQSPIHHFVESHIRTLFHQKIFWAKLHHCSIKACRCHVD